MSTMVMRPQVFLSQFVNTKAELCQKIQAIIPECADSFFEFLTKNYPNLQLLANDENLLLDLINDYLASDNLGNDSKIPKQEPALASTPFRAATIHPAPTATYPSVPIYTQPMQQQSRFVPAPQYYAAYQPRVQQYTPLQQPMYYQFYQPAIYQVRHN
jgi:hypothetical protein